MPQKNYYIAFDENGSPYLEHAFGDRFRSAVNTVGNAASNAASGLGRGVRQSHKYLMKVGEGAKARYFYTQDEIRAYYNQARQSASNVANRAKLEAKNKAKQVANNARSSANRIGNSLNEKANQTKDKVSDAWDKTKSEAKSTADRMRDAYQKRANQAKDLTSRVVNDLNGKANQAKEKISDIADKATDNWDKTKSEAKSTADYMRDEYKKRSEEAKDKISDAAGKVSDKAKEIYRDVSGETKREKEAIANKERSEKAAENKRQQRINDLYDLTNTIPVNSKNVSKEYLYELGSNTRFSSQVRDAMKNEDNYREAVRTLKNFADDAKNSNEYRAAQQAAEDAKKKYDESMNRLTSAINKGIVDAKNEIKDLKAESSYYWQNRKK